MTQPPIALPPGVDVIRRVPATELRDDALHASDPIRWLVHEARAAPSLAAMIDGLTQRLCGAGVALARLSIHLGTVHPQLLGYGCVWNRREGHSTEYQVRHVARDDDSYKRSPLRLVIENGEVIRRDPRLPEAQAEFTLMADLSADGITDYVVRPLGAISGAFSTVSYATDAPQRFGEADLALIERALPALLLNLDARIMLSIAGNVLDAYVGRRAGARVLRGEILRGQGERIDAVIWVSDLRDYTGLSDRLPDTDMIRLLNVYFEQLVNAILDHGGEVLKFMGDGLLAIFPVDPIAPRGRRRGGLRGRPGGTGRTCAAQCQRRRNTCDRWRMESVAHRNRFAPRPGVLRQHRRVGAGRFHGDRRSSQRRFPGGTVDQEARPTAVTDRRRGRADLPAYARARCIPIARPRRPDRDLRTR